MITNNKFVKINANYPTCNLCLTFFCNLTKIHYLIRHNYYYKNKQKFFYLKDKKKKH